MKTREQYIEEYSTLGNAAVPIAIYDVGQELVYEVKRIGNSLTYEVKTNLEDAIFSFKYASQAFQSVCHKIVDSYDGPLFHFKNAANAFRKSVLKVE